MRDDLTAALQAAGVPLAQVLDDPDGQDTIVVASGITLLPHHNGSVTVTALAHDGHGTREAIAQEAAIGRSAHTALHAAGFTVADYDRAANTFRVQPSEPA
ncbi:hypothetical protein [Streptomyces olivaceoviridis]|uniref:hypothetical protein n=1 Tax=Streptomyces olivaceoviridis TaxID=1921 RepID=UPI0036FA0FF3